MRETVKERPPTWFARRKKGGWVGNKVKKEQITETITMWKALRQAMFNAI